VFDIGFQEVVLVTIIGLIVIGPERLPKVARTIGLYVARMRRIVTEVRADVEREINTSDMRQDLKASGAISDFKEIVEDTKRSFEDARDALTEESAAIHGAVADAQTVADEETLPEDTKTLENSTPIGGEGADTQETTTHQVLTPPKEYRMVAPGYPAAGDEPAAEEDDSQPDDGSLPDNGTGDGPGETPRV
jgi:sec-independent protein translocase protein TatB